MSKQIETRLKIRRKNILLYRVLYKQLSDVEEFIKILGDKSKLPDPYMHLSLVRNALGIEPHITYERESDPKRKHKTFKPVTAEEALGKFMMLLSAPGFLPPKVTSLRNEEEMRAARTWLTEAKRRALHPPRHRLVKVFKAGPVKDFVTELLNSSFQGGFDIDMDEVMSLAGMKLRESDYMELRYEDEIAPVALEIGFLEDPLRMVFIAPGGQVLELHAKSLVRWTRSLDRMPGIREFFSELEESGAFPKGELDEG